MTTLDVRDRLLGRGIYDVAEVARLVRRPTREVAGWTRGTVGQSLLRPRAGTMFSFYDLMTAHVTAQLRRRDVPLSKIKDSREYLAKEYQTDWPLAHAEALEKLASAGSDVYEREGDIVDAAKGGQLAFTLIVGPLLRSIEFDATEMAVRWRPRDGVLIAPTVQAGAPCVDGTRVTTQVLEDLAQRGEDPAVLADDFGLSLAAVQAALAYEQELLAA